MRLPVPCTCIWSSCARTRSLQEQGLHTISFTSKQRVIRNLRHIAVAGGSKGGERVGYLGLLVIGNTKNFHQRGVIKPRRRLRGIEAVATWQGTYLMTWSKGRAWREGVSCIHTARLSNVLPEIWREKLGCAFSFFIFRSFSHHRLIYHTTPAALHR